MKSGVEETVSESGGLCHIAIDALPHQILILDGSGTVLAVNESWRAAASAYGLNAPHFGVGLNYLDICRMTAFGGTGDVTHISDGIESVLKGRRKEFQAEYRREGVRAVQWFVIRAVQYRSGAQSGAIISYEEITERKLAEIAAHESSERSRSVINSAVDSVVVIDEFGTIRDTNPACQKMFGYGPEELAGRNVRVLMPSPYRQEHDGYLSRYRETGVPAIIGTTRELIACRKSGDTFPIELSVSEFTSGGRRMFTGVIRDLTERRRAEQLNRDTGLLFRAVFEASSDGYILSSEDGRILNMNPAATEMLGVGPGQAGKVRVSDIVPADPASLRLSDGIPVSVPGTRYAVVSGKDGSQRDLAISLLRDATLGCHVWIIRDQTQAKREQELLLQDAFNHSAIAQNAPIGTAIMGFDGSLVSANPVLHEMLGYGSGELTDRRLTDILAPEDIPVVAEKLKEIGKPVSRVIRFEARHLHKSGKVVWGRITATLIGGESGGRHYILGMFEDLTGIRQLTGNAERMTRIFRQQSLAEALLAPSGRVLEANDAFCRYFGLSESQLISRPVSSLFLQIDEVGLKRLLEGGKNASVAGNGMIVSYRRSDGVLDRAFAIVSRIQGETRQSDIAVIHLVPVPETSLTRQSNPAANNLYRLLETVPCGIQECDVEGTITFSNSAHSTMKSLVPGALVGRKIWDFLESDAAKAEFKEYFALLVSTKPKPTPYEGWERTADGRRLKVRVDWDYLHDSTGRLTGFIAALTDVTDRARVEEELKSIEGVLSRIVANMPGAVYRCEMTSEYGCVFLSDQVEKITGYPAADFMIGGPRKFGDLIHPDDAVKINALVEALVRRQQPFDLTYRIRHRDGSYRWVRDVGQGLLAEDGSIRWLDGIFTDITAAWRRDHAMRALTERADGKVGAEFFDTLVRQIAETLDNRIAFASRISDVDTSEFECIAMWDSGCAASPFTYSAHGSPCAVLKERNSLCVPTHLQALYPVDEWVRGRGLDSYAAVRLTDGDGNYVGHIGVMHDKPLDDAPGTVEILQLFAARALAELQRMRAEEKLQTAHRELEAAVAAQTRELRCANDSLKRLVTVTRDAQTNLRVKDQALETAVNAIAMGGLDGRLTYVNRAFLRLWGFEDISEVIGRHAVEFWKSQDEASDVVETLGAKGGWSGEMVALRRDGTYVDVHLTAHLVRDDDGTPLCMMGSFVDITAQKTATEMLKESEERYRSVVAALDEGIVYHDHTGRIITSNRRAGEILGLRTDEIEGTTPFDPPWEAIRESGEPLPADERPSWVTLKTGQPLSNVIIGARRRDHGKVRWLSVNSMPVFRDNQTGPSAVVVTFRDITEIREAEVARRELENQLHQAQKLDAVGRLAGGLAHDFSNLLGVISGHAQLLRMNMEPSQRQWKDVGNILDAAQSAARLTRQLLTFSRPAALKPEVIALDQALSRNVQLLRRLIRENVRVSVSIGENVGSVRMDRSQLEQIVVNLAINAADAMPNGGELTVEAALCSPDSAELGALAAIYGGTFCAVIISDTGQGMTPEVKERIFEPFFTTKAPGKGTGLGLYSVYGIVRAMGGHIHVRSEPGKGSRFTILLPKVDAEQEASGPVEAKGTGGSETILVVEDQEQLREITVRTLKGLGYTVIDASDGEIAEAIVRSSGADLHLVITDVVMPKMSGRQLAERIRSIRPGLRIMFTTGYDPEIIRDQGLSDAQGDLLLKPYDLDQLARKVREMLSRPASK